jgi:hypothetical protein
MSFVVETAPPTSAPGETTDSTSLLTWELVFDGVWVARRDGEFAGMVQSSSDCIFKLTDERGLLTGQFASLYEARNALISRW